VKLTNFTVSDIVYASIFGVNHTGFLMFVPSVQFLRRFYENSGKQQQSSEPVAVIPITALTAAQQSRGVHNVIR